ncbi:MAG: efflux protein, LysE family, partial [uncultured Nocardioidaceae bacterium]
ALRNHAADLRGALARLGADAGAEHALPRVAQPRAGHGRGHGVARGVPDGFARHHALRRGGHHGGAVRGAVRVGRATARRRGVPRLAGVAVRAAGRAADLRAAADAARGLRAAVLRGLRHGGPEPQGGAVLRGGAAALPRSRTGQRLSPERRARGRADRGRHRVRRGAGVGRGRDGAVPRHAAVLDGLAALGARRGARAARPQARHAIARL